MRTCILFCRRVRGRRRGPFPKGHFILFFNVLGLYRSAARRATFRDQTFMDGDAVARVPARPAQEAAACPFRKRQRLRQRTLRPPTRLAPAPRPPPNLPTSPPTS